MSSPIYLRNSLRLCRHTSPSSIVSRISSASSHLSYSTGSNPTRTESNRSDRVPTNDSSPPPPIPNVSETNAVPTSTWGKQDALLQEDPEVAEQRRVMQAPNRLKVWSRSQERREVAMRGPRFEQTIMELQVCDLLFPISGYYHGFFSGAVWQSWSVFVGEGGSQVIYIRRDRAHAQENRRMKIFPSMENEANDFACLAATPSRHRTDPQAACTVDQ